MNRGPFLVGLGGALLAGCAASASSTSYAILGADDEPLKRTFNQDVGKVRVLMLVSPT